MARFLKNREPSKGAAPGSVIFLGRKKAAETTVRYMYYNQEHVSDVQNVSIGDIEHVHSDAVNWINIYGLHDVEKITSIGSLFHIPSLILEDIVNTDHRPKIVEFDGGVLVIVKSFIYNKEDEKIHTDQISFILGSNYVLCFQEKYADFFDSVRRRIHERVGKVRQFGHDYLLYALIDTLVDNTLVLLEKIGTKIEQTEHYIPQAHKNLALEIYQYKNEISYIRKNVRPYKEIVYALRHGKVAGISSSIAPYTDDLYELVNQTLDSVELYYSMVNDQLNLYNTYVSNKANDIMKFLTIFASIFIPLTFIAGIYGTNFEYVPELKYKYSYFIMLAGMFLLAVGMLVYFKIKKWL
ncbi:MAG: magnesium/cobalt transporter CorA [Bacteroidales bacterium]